MQQFLCETCACKDLPFMHFQALELWILHDQFLVTKHSIMISSAQHGWTCSANRPASPWLFLAEQVWLLVAVIFCYCDMFRKDCFRDDGGCGRFLAVENQKHPWNGLASATAICCHSSPVNSRFHRSVDCIVQENTVCKCQTRHPILKPMSCEI